MSESPTLQAADDLSGWARDRGLLLGDGLFETILADRGRLVRFEGHIARLARGCDILGLPRPSFTRLREAADLALVQGGLTDRRAAIRLTWTAGSGGRGLERPQDVAPRLLVAATEIDRPGTPAVLALTSIRRNPTSPTARLKTLAYIDNVLARREAVAAGADEALMLNTQGEVACASAANVFWIIQGRLFTPALDCGALDGVVRAEVLRQAPGLGLAVVEAHEAVEALEAADGLFLTSSLIGLRPVRRFAGRDYPTHALLPPLAGACAWAL